MRGLWSKPYIGLHVKYPLFLLDFNKTLTFSTGFFWKRQKYKSLWISVHWEPSCSMRTEGPTYVTKLMVAFRSFANGPKNALCVAIKMWRLKRGRPPKSRIYRIWFKLLTLPNIMLRWKINRFYIPLLQGFPNLFCLLTPFGFKK